MTPVSFKERPIGPRGPREFKEGPGASSGAIKGRNGELEGEKFSAQFWATCMFGEFRDAGLADLKLCAMLEKLGGRPNT